MPRDFNQVDYETLSITGTAGGLATLPARGRCFVGSLETAQARARGDGTDPTSSEGEIINVGDKVYLSHSELRAMKFIRTGSTSAVLKGHYYDVEVAVLLGAA
tara:strand:- start:91 stop:399 length:309 start_codon:yes stop_codon:yes gene_type:complete